MTARIKILLIFLWVIFLIIIWSASSKYQLTMLPRCHSRFQAYFGYRWSRNKSSISGVTVREREEPPKTKLRNLSLRVGPHLHADIPFRGARRGNFFQERPQLGNVFVEDAPLRSYIQRLLPAEVHVDSVLLLKHISLNQMNKGVKV